MVVACQDGYLRIFDWEKDKLILSAKSYYGGFLCVDWSRDGRYIIAGGEDDLVTLWEWTESTYACVCRARGEGHQSWVSAVSFDNYYKGDPNIYRFGSVGEDGKLCIWEYNATEFLTTEVRKKRGDSIWAKKSLPNLKTNGMSRNSSDHDLILLSTLTNGHPPSTNYDNNNNNGNNNHSPTNGTATRTTSTAPTNGHKDKNLQNKDVSDFDPKSLENSNWNQSLVIVRVPLRNGVDEIIPITTHTVHHGPCSGLAFLSTRDIVTVAWGGDVKYWQFCKSE